MHILLCESRFVESQTSAAQPLVGYDRHVICIAGTISQFSSSRWSRRHSRSHIELCTLSQPQHYSVRRARFAKSIRVAEVAFTWAWDSHGPSRRLLHSLDVAGRLGRPAQLDGMA